MPATKRSLQTVSLRLGDLWHRRRRVHVLHIGKTAGTALREAVLAVPLDDPGRIRFIHHGHYQHLDALPRRDGYAFALRDPATRFVSGFYSRKRQGLPRYHIPWTPEEARAFATFDHAVDLARALGEDGDGRAAAAMAAIRHVRDFQSDWLAGYADPFAERPPVFVLRQERFEADLAEMFRRLGIVSRRPPPRDEIGAHRTDYAGVPPLDDVARANLRRWYARDYDLIDRAEVWRAAQGIGPGTP